ncbi:hypothetical protein CEXT_153721 [Caerostris extrusa]|uniref:Uncharacterized protein n=1 Tax=Caerostris extrusa TaxID=172846 RepID=A0AAV4NRK0_CAEEX|nr:hypothetical protein CEXT_153721 [Caerostris extrusa]
MDSSRRSIFLLIIFSSTLYFCQAQNVTLSDLNATENSNVIFETILPEVSSTSFQDETTISEIITQPLNTEVTTISEIITQPPSTEVTTISEIITQTSSTEVTTTSVETSSLSILQKWQTFEKLSKVFAKML